VVVFNGKVTDTDDKLFSHCTPPRDTGEKKVREEAGVAIGWQGEQRRRHVVE
jgi:hypothetical protein